ncbi:PTH1 family peptidyl-tRNA hydrolase [Bradyrhizobium sp. cir1]|uniref:aminoacyl-tRNA hydrolase n=1 Tax=Bradyrhizobium sp. cir1 TaxID=1445730 RepID=UPI0016064ECE|nr:aminoacyl-tRNA hydrolase [Bradyrhizobium sp. cir1]MBB4370167.1 PTH1 family peptidyl-tRNA hydrolase [Bradyrhizobium sp. cir1]
MRLFVGLGNPGAQYRFNRHNVGFIVVDAIAERYRFNQWRQHPRFEGELATGMIDGEQVMLLKPSTYMNASGLAVLSVLSFYKLHRSDLSVFHDEIELPPAGFRVKVDGGDAGHNGLGSITERIGPNYRRVRIGVGRPIHKSQVEGYVLGNFTTLDMEWLSPMINSIVENIGLLIRNQDSSFQNKVHVALQAAGFGKRGNRSSPT